MRRISVRIVSRSPASRFDSGSSSSSRCGRLTSARASATRCCWPPESWPAVGRGGRRCARARRSHARAAARRDHRGRDHDAVHRERVRVLCIPVRWRGRDHRRAQPGVGAVGRPPARRARAHLHRGLQPLRPHDRGRRVPVRRRGGRERGGAPRRRRRDPARRARPGASTPRPNARVGAAPHRACTPTPRACGSASSASTTSRCAPPSRSGMPVTEEIERGPRSRCSCAASRCSTARGRVGRGRAAPRHLRAAPP